MNAALLEEKIKKLLFSDDISIYVLDAINDEVINYDYSNGTIVLKNKESYTDFIDNIKLEIDPSYLSSYMNYISVPKLEEKEKESRYAPSFEYKTLRGTSYTNSYLTFDYEGRSLVLIVQRKKNNIDDNNIEDDVKYNNLVESISDSIYKVHNVFSFNKNSNVNIKSIEDYINSVFSELINTHTDVKNALNKNALNISGMADGTLLIVDDDLVTRNMIKKIFNGQYKIAMATNGKEAIDYLEENSKKGLTESSDNILGIFLDLTMPVLDGFAVLEYLNKKNYLSKIPVIIISGDYEKETKARVYNYNIADMLEKPFDFQIVKHRIGNFINLYKYSNSLNELINDQGTELKSLINNFVDSYRYDYEKNIKNLTNYMTIFGKQVMKDYPEYNLFEETINKMADAIMYYDFGFYAIPRIILAKKNGFDNNELDIIKKYPLFSEKMIKYLLSLTNDEEYKRYAIDIAKHYHENYDGTGYPNNLKGNSIPLVAQMAAIIIMYNNLVKKDKQTASEEIMKRAGSMFNPKLVQSFIKVINDISGI